MPKVTIVVPIYRVENYLSQCVDSLLAQTLPEIEIILVDDGSPDKCPEIADHYAQKDSRVKVIHQKNAGLGPARNTGIQAASGEYIGFVDSDDWARPEMFQRLYEAAVRSNADIVVSGHCDIVNGIAVLTKQHPLAGTTLTSHKEIMEVRKQLFGHSPDDHQVVAFPMSVWISLYRKKMILDNQILFRNILSEDTIFNLDVYRYADVITFTGDTDYCYRKEGQTSITQTFSADKQKKYVDFLLLLKEKTREESDSECALRAKRMTIDYHRLYAGILDRTGESFSKKTQYLKAFAEDSRVRSCWQGYPIETLPIKQRLFHKALMNKHYGAALLMNRLRRKLKNKG
ncbi:MAG: glycosyltransferase [Eubacterium sp.]|nr:glycosyltransferase [Eubacterium sp.]